MTSNGIAKTVKTTFSRTTTISEIIDAESSKVWSLLTEAEQYPHWNSTIVSLDGSIERGGSIKLKSTLDPSRTFKLKVKEFVPREKLVWGDAMGQRSFVLKRSEQGTIFTMTEKIGGLLFPLFASKIPSFDQSFEQFAADLKKAAEANC